MCARWVSRQILDSTGKRIDALRRIVGLRIAAELKECLRFTTAYDLQKRFHAREWQWIAKPVFTIYTDWLVKMSGPIGVVAADTQVISFKVTNIIVIRSNVDMAGGNVAWFSARDFGDDCVRVGQKIRAQLSLTLDS